MEPSYESLALVQLDEACVMPQHTDSQDSSSIEVQLALVGKDATRALHHTKNLKALANLNHDGIVRIEPQVARNEREIGRARDHSDQESSEVRAALGVLTVELTKMSSKQDQLYVEVLTLRVWKDKATWALIALLIGVVGQLIALAISFAR